MTAERRVGLVAVADGSRSALAEYLRSAGFDVVECDELAVPSSFGALVWRADDTDGAELVARVRSWLRLARHQRIIVVTSRPAALRDVVAAHGERLFALPAPVFGWELVEALRATQGPKPRGA
ncbi:MAG: hypothetical protein E6J90_02245 [Deltaproteobacteria bacterium]|nr:MAG: hypothetical protein E6J91_15730 [Deltaproteobacteria bacterium]TMQ27619.1 MAG: hypothetical protein E6J90_02245 [Deltaproteobacteria bacterium]